MNKYDLFSLYLIFFILGNNTIFSQSTTLLFKNITIEEGLSQNSVVDIVQDSLGFMWFATQDGLNRYDGKNFKIYPRSFDDINGSENFRLGKLDIYNNRLWMITRGGKLEVLNIPADKINGITHFKNNQKIPTVRSIYQEAEDKIWIGTEKEGVFLVDAKMEIVQHFHMNASPPFQILSNKINSLFEDSGGNIWILTDNGVNKISKSTNEIYLKGYAATTIAEDKFGLIYIGTQGTGVFLKSWVETVFGKLAEIPKIHLPPDLVVRSLLADKNGDLWVGTYGNGLYLINMKNRKVEHYLPGTKNPNSIGSHDILNIYQNKENGIWIGTDGGGISYYAETFRNFKSLTPQQVPNDVSIEQVRAIVTDSEGDVWIGTSANGITVYDPKDNNFQSVILKPTGEEARNSNRILALNIDYTGDIWIGTNGDGAIIIDSQTKEIKKWFTKENPIEALKIPDNNIVTFLRESDNTYWAGTRYSGLLLLNKEKGFLNAYKTGSADPDNLLAIERINDTILALGYEGKGLKLFNTRRKTFRNLYPKFFQETLDRVNVKSLFYKNNWLWVGTGGKGIVVINLKTGIIKQFNEKDGLPDRIIYAILEQDSRTLWMSSNKGIFRITYKKVNGDLNIEQIESYDKTIGLQSNKYNTGAFHQSKDGLIYFGGLKGLSYFDPEKVPRSEENYNVVITEVVKDNVPFRGFLSMPYLDKIRLLYKDNSLALNYTAINFISPEKLNYTYKLEGYDEDWVEAGSRDYTAYTNLPPGEYQFKVKLADNILNDPQYASLGIHIASPFWYSWWFITLLLLLIISIIYAFYKVRIYQFMELQKVKDGISADLHDDLGSRLTTIHLLSAITKKKFQKNPELSKVLKNIEKEIYASSEALDEIVWNIKMTEESLPDMIAKIRRYISEVLENDEINYSIESSENFDQYKLSMRKRRELFLICKELITNIRKHSNASRVEFKIAPDRDSLYVSVFDNGRGFDPHQVTHRNGISNLKKRVLRWNGRLKIQSEPREGCLIEVWIPFDKNNLLEKIFQK